MILFGFIIVYNCYKYMPKFMPKNRIFVNLICEGEKLMINIYFKHYESTV